MSDHTRFCSSCGYDNRKGGGSGFSTKRKATGVFQTTARKAAKAATSVSEKTYETGFDDPFCDEPEDASPDSETIETFAESVISTLAKESKPRRWFFLIVGVACIAIPLFLALTALLEDTEDFSGTTYDGAFLEIDFSGWDVDILIVAPGRTNSFSDPAEKVTLCLVDNFRGWNRSIAALKDDAQAESLLSASDSGMKILQEAQGVTAAVNSESNYFLFHDISFEENALFSFEPETYHAETRNDSLLASCEFFVKQSPATRGTFYIAKQIGESTYLIAYSLFDESADPAAVNPYVEKFLFENIHWYDKLERSLNDK